MRIWFVIASLLIACGQDSAPPAADAADVVEEPDAPAACPLNLEECDTRCVNTRADREHCGACGNACVPAASCEASECACPATFLGGTHQVLATTMIAAQPGFVSGVDGVLGRDSASHGVVVTAAITAPLGTPLAVNGNVFVAIAYAVSTGTQARSTFLATAGTVTLSRRCAAGIAGSLANLALVEVDPVTFAPIAGGCTTTVTQLAFDVGGPCP